MLSVGIPTVPFNKVADKIIHGKHNMPSELTPLTSFLPRVEVPIVSLHKYLLDKLFIHSDQFLIECETNISHGFYQLELDSRSIAAALNELGLKEGEVFGICGQNSYEYLVLYLGAMIAGAVVYGIPSTDSYQEICDKIIQRNLKFLSISSKNISIAKRISEGIPITQKIIVFNGGQKLNSKFELYSELVDSYEPLSEELISLPTDPKETECLILSTSGCLTRPKTMVFTHYSVVSALEVTSCPLTFGYTQSEVVSSHCEFGHQLGIFQTLTAICTGSKVAIMPGFDRNQFVNCVKKYRISAAILSPQSIMSLIKDSEDNDLSTTMSSLTKVISCGSVLPKSVATQFVERFKSVKDLRQGLFQSECMAPITLMIKNSQEYESVGVPTPNTTVIIKEWQSGQLLGANQIGEICVQRKDALCKHYLTNSDISEPLFDYDQWLRTRVLGYYDEDRLLYVIGSVDEMIRSNNSLIAPSELEALLLSHSAVAESAVIGVTDQTLGQMAVGFVVLKKKSIGKVMDAEITDFVNNQMPKKKNLNAVYVMNYLPKTICAKVSKRKLREELCLKIIKQKF